MCHLISMVPLLGILSSNQSLKRGSVLCILRHRCFWVVIFVAAIQAVSAALLLSQAFSFHGVLFRGVFPRPYSPGS